MPGRVPARYLLLQAHRARTVAILAAIQLRAPAKGGRVHQPAQALCGGPRTRDAPGVEARERRSRRRRGELEGRLPRLIPGRGRRAARSARSSPERRRPALAARQEADPRPHLPGSRIAQRSYRRGRRPRSNGARIAAPPWLSRLGQGRVLALVPFQLVVPNYSEPCAFPARSLARRM